MGYPRYQCLYGLCLADHPKQSIRIEIWSSSLVYHRLRSSGSGHAKSEIHGLLLAQTRNDIVILPRFETWRFRLDRVSTRPSAVGSWTGLHHRSWRRASVRCQIGDRHCGAGHDGVGRIPSGACPVRSRRVPSVVYLREVHIGSPHARPNWVGPPNNGLLAGSDRGSRNRRASKAQDVQDVAAMDLTLLRTESPGKKW